MFLGNYGFVLVQEDLNQKPTFVEEKNLETLFYIGPLLEFS